MHEIVLEGKQNKHFLASQNLKMKITYDSNSFILQQQNIKRSAFSRLRGRSKSSFKDQKNEYPYIEVTKKKKIIITFLIGIK